MASDRRQQSPNGLRAPGRLLWNRVTEGVTLRPDELALLEHAAKVTDQAVALEQELEGQSLLISGSQGQQVLNPLVSELRQQRGLLASLLGRLDLPEADEGVVNEWDGLTSSQRARKAAGRRWKAA